MRGVRQFVFLLSLVLGCAGVSQAKDIAVIVNKGNAAKNLSSAELTKMCKLSARKWPGGRTVLVVMRDPSSPEMKLVLRKLYGMSAEEVRDLLAAGSHDRAQGPAVLFVDSDEVLVKMVATNPGAIGLVDVYSITGAINVLKIDGKSPLEPGYTLHGN
jgi:ABC-type phosphate transport system substrate-binding protein